MNTTRDIDTEIHETIARGLDNYILAARLAYMATRPGHAQAFSKKARDAYMLEAARRLMPNSDDPIEAARAHYAQTF